MNVSIISAPVGSGSWNNGHLLSSREKEMETETKNKQKNDRQLPKLAVCPLFNVYFLTIVGKTLYSEEDSETSDNSYTVLLPSRDKPTTSQNSPVSRPV